MAHLEYAALNSPYIQGISSMGIDVAFRRCPKRDGGNIKKGTQWGKLTYCNYSMNMPLSRQQAIDWMMLPLKVKQAKIAMAQMKVCAICGNEEMGQDDPINPRRWGRLRYQEKPMDICPDCIKEIYEESYRPWENN